MEFVYSTVLVNDTLISFGSRISGIAQEQRVGVLDLALRKWQEVSLHGDELRQTDEMAVDYWESRGKLLLSQQGRRYQREMNKTFAIDLRTWKVEHVRTKGMEPSRRYDESSCLLDIRGGSKWFIAGGIGDEIAFSVETDPMNYLYVLDLENWRSPTWSSICCREEFGYTPGLSLLPYVGDKLIVLGGRLHGYGSDGYVDLKSGEWVDEGFIDRGDVLHSTPGLPSSRLWLSTNSTVFLLPRYPSDAKLVYRIDLE